MSEARGGYLRRGRVIVVILMTIVILAFVNLQIAGKERVLQEGRTVLLRLAPVDPRSLLQGDYIALRYAMADEIAAASKSAGLSNGTIVVQLDEDGVARFLGLDRGQALAPDQQRLVFRKRGETVRLASDAFFFEEGAGGRYRDVRYGELRVARNGSAVLVGLRMEDLQPPE